MTISDLMKELGGNAFVASALGVGRNVVGQWVFRNRIPRSAWPDVIQTFPVITMDRLLTLEAEADEGVMVASSHDAEATSTDKAPAAVGHAAGEVGE